MLASSLAVATACSYAMAVASLMRRSEATFPAAIRGSTSNQQIVQYCYRCLAISIGYAKVTVSITLTHNVDRIEYVPTSAL